MIRVPVKSSAVASVGHDAATNVLEVEYRSGYVYALGGISKKDFDALLAADSIGQHMNALKAKAESTTRVGDPKTTNESATVAG